MTVGRHTSRPGTDEKIILANFQIVCKLSGVCERDSEEKKEKETDNARYRVR